MRENIGMFKAKRIDTKEWVQGCLSVLNDECMIAIGYRHHNELDNPHCTWVDVYKDTVSQFTGLKDKNGKLIFENDIIKFENGAEYEIIFEDYMFKISNETHKEALFESEFDDVEVIGDKFEEVD